MKTTAVSRRNALGGAATIGLSLPLLAACGDDAADTGTDPATADPSTPASSAPSSQPPASDGPAPAAGIVTTSDVPVGSGLVVPDSEVVVTQPTQGDFRAFTAICTHQGCTVGDVTDTINCPCHGSTFSISDGSPTGGPAQAPLAEIPISVDGDQISLA